MHKKLRAAAVIVVLILAVASTAATYVVQRGDSLSKIAEQHNTTVEAIVEANSIRNPNRIYVGQELVIPGSGDTTYLVRPGDTLASIAAKLGVTESQLAAANGITNPNLIYVGTRLRIEAPPAEFHPETGEQTTYKIRRGDTLGRIAARFGTTVQDLAAANGITNPNRIVAGSTLVVRSGGWLCPVPGATFFNDWGFPRSGGRFHQGNDLFAPRGTPVYAPVSGVVKQVNGHIGGHQVNLYGDDGALYIGSHLDRFGANGRVTAGTIIGYVGDSGNAAGSRPHLHFEIHPDNGEAVNPYPTLVSACK